IMLISRTYNQHRITKVFELLTHLKLEKEKIHEITNFNIKINLIANTILNYKNDNDEFQKLSNKTFYILESYILNTLSVQGIRKNSAVKIDNTLDDRIRFKMCDKLMFEKNDFYFLYQEYLFALENIYNDHLYLNKCMNRLHLLEFNEKTCDVEYYPILNELL
ncbi:hypothetical protein COBT_001665, partial [Conglomerata obtusa]